MNKKKTKKPTPDKVVPVDRIPDTPLRFAWALTKLTLGWAILAVIAVTIAKLLGVSLAFILKRIIDVANTPGSSPEEVFMWVFLFPTVVFFMFLAWRLSGFFGM